MTPPRTGAARRARRRVGFVAHELAEYAIGAALIALGIHFTNGLEEQFIFIGAALITLNLVTRATLGAVKIVGRRLHHLFDYLLIAYAAASPFFGFVRHDLRAALLTELVTLLLVFIEQSTRYVEAPHELRNIRDARVVDPKRSAVHPGAKSTSPTVSGAVARQLGIFTAAALRANRSHRDAVNTTGRPAKPQK